MLAVKGKKIVLRRIYRNPYKPRLCVFIGNKGFIAPIEAEKDLLGNILRISCVFYVAVCKAEDIGLEFRNIFRKFNSVYFYQSFCFFRHTVKRFCT